MHYYKRSIGDYHRKAGRLNILQHGVYNLLIDACYDREKFPTREEAIDWIWAESDEEIAAVDYVLKKFFQQDDEGRFMQNHIREDLEKYHNRLITQTENGKKGGRPKKAVGHNSEPDDNLDETQNNPMGFDEKPNETQDKPSLVKPLTTNHKPLNQEPLNNLGSSSSGEVVEAKFIDLGFEGLPDQYRDMALTEYPNLKTSTLTGIWQRFAKYYRDKPQVVKTLQGWLSLWAESLERYAQAEIDKASAPKPQPVRPAHNPPQRTTDTTKQRERKFEDYHDSQKYSGVFTAGQIRENLQDGETPDQCVLRLTKAMLGKAGA